MRITIQIDRTSRGGIADPPVAVAATRGAATGEPAPAMDAGPAPSDSLASLAEGAGQLDEARSAGPAPTSADDERGGT